MRYPLPYAFARSQQLLLEDDGEQLVLWHAGTPARGWSEVLRKFRVRNLQQLSPRARAAHQRGVRTGSRARPPW